MSTNPTLPAKSIVTSWTIWLNVAVVLLAAADQLLGILQPLLGVHTYQVLAGLLVAGNTLLRVFKTDAPVALTAAPWAWADGAGAPKALVESKTVWFNLLMSALSAALATSGGPLAQVLQGVVGSHGPEILTGVLAAGNVLLRLVTDRPVTLTGEPRSGG